jgi:hypothetical protein
MAASTSKKHENFIRESMLKDGNPKGVDELAGVGPKATAELTEKGLTQAHMLLVSLFTFQTCLSVVFAAFFSYF